MQNYRKKEIVPIVSGNTKILGMSTPEWCIHFTIFIFYSIILRVPMGLGLSVHVPCVIVYIAFLSKLEENIIFVLIQSFKIPNVLVGSFNKMIPERFLRKRK